MQSDNCKTLFPNSTIRKLAHIDLEYYHSEIYLHGD